LRTPITRLKLRLEFLDDDEQRLKMLADLDEMESMIAETLAFARADAARDVDGPVDLTLLLRDLCDQFGTGFTGQDQVTVTAREIGLKRAFANLLENATKYARSVHVALIRGGDGVTVMVDDDGPGIAEIELDRVFAPFYRLETSRSRETGGTGLGLAVARSAVRAHGGDIVLTNRPGGGLRVTVSLPV
jgi:signal transduction histidine kinase